MKIAVVTDDGKIISSHFGRATKYSVYTIEHNRVVFSEMREKVGHREFQQEGMEDHHHSEDHRGRGFGKHSAEKHRRMFETITDCQVILARGMGKGAYNGLLQSGIQPVITDIPEIESAIQAVIDGSIENHPERMH